MLAAPPQFDSPAAKGEGSVLVSSGDTAWAAITLAKETF
jgi:hypothetical protein